MMSPDQLGVSGDRRAAAIDSISAVTLATHDMARALRFQAVLGTLADAYPTAVQVPRLAAEVDCQSHALYRHLRLLHDVGAIRANARGEILEAASITDAGLLLVRRHDGAFDCRSQIRKRH
jgi:hypothetical protein